MDYSSIISDFYCQDEDEDNTYYLEDDINFDLDYFEIKEFVIEFIEYGMENIGDPEYLFKLLSPELRNDLDICIRMAEYSLLRLNPRKDHIDVICSSFDGYCDPRDMNVVDPKIFLDYRNLLRLLSVCPKIFNYRQELSKFAGRSVEEIRKYLEYFRSNSKMTPLETGLDIKIKLFF